MQLGLPKCDHAFYEWLIEQVERARSVPPDGVRAAPPSVAGPTLREAQLQAEVTDILAREFPYSVEYCRFVADKIVTSSMAEPAARDAGYRAAIREALSVYEHEPSKLGSWLRLRTALAQDGARASTEAERCQFRVLGLAQCVLECGHEGEHRAMWSDVQRLADRDAAPAELRETLAAILTECLNFEQTSATVRHRVRRIAEAAIAANSQPSPALRQPDDAAATEGT